MSITKKELEERVKQFRSLKSLKDETEKELKLLESEIISYMKENELSEEFTETSKITYSSQSRTTLDKARLETDLGSLSEYEKTTTYNVLRIK